MKYHEIQQNSANLDENHIFLANKCSFSLFFGPCSARNRFTRAFFPLILLGAFCLLTGSSAAYAQTDSSRAQSDSSRTQPEPARAQREEGALAQIEAAEPGIDAVRRQVLRVYGWSDPDLDDWSSRARWSHLLPELKGEVAWLDQQDIQARYREDMKTSEEGLIFVGGAQNNYHNDSRLRSIYAVTVKWKLSGLIYDTSEPRIAAEVSRRRKARQELLFEVGETYYARRQFQVEFFLTSSSQWRKRLEVKLEIDRYTARLDAMSEGWFSGEISRLAQERAEQGAANSAAARHASGGKTP